MTTKEGKTTVKSVFQNSLLYENEKSLNQEGRRRKMKVAHKRGREAFSLSYLFSAL